jgi:Amt family ammonium transporter
MTILKFLHLSQMYCERAPERRRGAWRCSLLLAVILWSASGAFAQAAAPADFSKASPGEKLTQLDQRVTAAQSSADNAWMLVSAALVLMMTGPGLALFYGGLVRRKNVLGTMMHSFV